MHVNSEGHTVLPWGEHKLVEFNAHGRSPSGIIFALTHIEIDEILTAARANGPNSVPLLAVLIPSAEGDTEKPTEAPEPLVFKVTGRTSTGKHVPLIAWGWQLGSEPLDLPVQMAEVTVSDEAKARSTAHISCRVCWQHSPPKEFSDGLLAAWKRGPQPAKDFFEAALRRKLEKVCPDALRGLETFAPDMQSATDENKRVFRLYCKLLDASIDLLRSTSGVDAIFIDRLHMGDTAAVQKERNQETIVKYDKRANVTLEMALSDLTRLTAHLGLVQTKDALSIRCRKADVVQVTKLVLGPDAVAGSHTYLIKGLPAFVTLDTVKSFCQEYLEWPAQPITDTWRTQRGRQTCKVRADPPPAMLYNIAGEVLEVSEALPKWLQPTNFTAAAPTQPKHTVSYYASRTVGVTVAHTPRRAPAEIYNMAAGDTVDGEMDDFSDEHFGLNIPQQLLDLQDLRERERLEFEERLQEQANHNVTLQDQLNQLQAQMQLLLGNTPGVQPGTSSA